MGKIKEMQGKTSEGRHAITLQSLYCYYQKAYFSFSFICFQSRQPENKTTRKQSNKTREDHHSFLVDHDQDQALSTSKWTSILAASG